MDLGAVMDEVAELLATLTDLRVYAWPVEQAQPPAAIVAYPTAYTFDETYNRGMDRMTLPVVVLVGRAVDRTARDKLSSYVDGPASVKRTLESGGPYQAFDTVRVGSPDFDIYELAANKYLAAIFDLDITGKGS